MQKTTIKHMFLIAATLATLAATEVVSQELDLTQEVSAATMTQSDIVVSQNNRDDAFWTKPYGQDGAQYLGSMKQYEGLKIPAAEVGETITIGETTWRHITIHGQTGYADVNAFANVVRGAVIDISPFRYQVAFNSGGGGIWTKPYGIPGAEYLGGTVGDMRSFYVDKIAKIQNNGITTEWIHLQNYGWVDRTNTRSQIIMSEINYTLFGRYGILPRNYDLYSEYGSQLRQAGLTGINQLNF